MNAHPESPEGSALRRVAEAMAALASAMSVLADDLDRRGLGMPSGAGAGTHDGRALTPQEAAAHLGVSTSTLKRLTAAAQVVSLTIGSRRRYMVEDLDSYLRTRRDAGAAGASARTSATPRPLRSLPPVRRRAAHG